LARLECLAGEEAVAQDLAGKQIPAGLKEAIAGR